MSIAIDPKGKRGFITPSDLAKDGKGEFLVPEDRQTEWLIRDLNERQRVAYMDSVRLVDDGVGGGALGGQGSRVYTALKGGLVGVSEAKPFRDSKGEPIPFEKNSSGQVSDEFLQRIIWSEKVSISTAITESMMLDQEDVEK